MWTKKVKYDVRKVWKSTSVRCRLYLPFTLLP
jgi:hypothetical protein